MLIVPKNWREFQHYKDRCPPWIRLHRKLLDDRDFNALPPMACKVLVLLWLVAADTAEGAFEDNAADLAFRLRLPEKEVEAALKLLKAKRFFVPAASEEDEPQPSSAKQMAERNGYGSRHISDKVKREVWDRDGGTCCACGSTDDIEYDHKTPVSRGGTSEAENIQLLCRPCNRKKRAKTADQVATHAQPGLSQRTTETEAFTEPEADSETEAETGFGQPARAGRPAAKLKSAATWEAYTAAYEGRYGVKPVRNAKVNAQMAQFVALVAIEEAPLIAAFYVSNDSRFYVQVAHSVGILVRDAEKLRTEWATGRRGTAAQAVLADRTQANFNAFAPLIAEAQAKEQINGKH